MLPSMAVIPEHETPKTKQDCIDTWRNSGRIGVPGKSGGVIDLLIVSLYETTSVNGLPLDALLACGALPKHFVGQAFHRF